MGGVLRRSPRRTRAGQGEPRLTPLGEKMVWAGQRLQARLRPQLQNLAQELEAELNAALPQRETVIRVHASHGFAVSKLRELMSRDPTYRRGSALRRQPELAGLTRARRLRAGGRSLAARRAAQESDRRRPPVGERERAPSHRIRDARNGNHGEARQSPAHHVAREAHDARCSLRESRPRFRYAAAVRSVDRAAWPGRRLVSTATSASSSRTRQWPHMWQAEWRTRPSASKPPRVSSIWISCGSPRRTISLSAGSRRSTTRPVKRMLEIMRSEEFRESVAALPGYTPSDAGVVKPVLEALRGA